MKSKFVIVAVALCAMSAQAFAEVNEQTSKDYETKVQMSLAKQQQLRDLAVSIINNTYSDVLTKWNTLSPNGFTQVPQSQMKYQFQGSIEYHMALSKPDEAKSDADVAFLYLYNSGNNQPNTATIYASKLKGLARDAFKSAYAGYTYEIKNPVVAINVPVSGLTPDHVDIAFFDELLQATAVPSKANCVLGSIKTSPCSELNWGVQQSDSVWPPSDRLNLTATLNAGFDTNPTNREIINRAGKIFKEWRFGLYAANEEKVPSIALVTLMYNLLKGGTITYTNTFMLLRDTLSKGAKDNFDNGNCTARPQDFKIVSITYPFADFLSNLKTEEKRTFCLNFMDFKSAVEYATKPANEVTNAQAVERLKPYLPLFP